MAPSRRLSNGRSPLVNPQRQITSFFSKSLSSPLPSPAVTKNCSKTHPNPNSNSDPSSSPGPGPSPTTPSPIQSRQKKPRLMIGPSPAAPALHSAEMPYAAKETPYGDEVVGKKIRVYWPLDQAWYRGFVKSFDKASGEHLVQYDDSDEEVLNLLKEKIEWIEESSRRFRRLRRLYPVEEAVAQVEIASDASSSDSSSDEDWGKNVADETREDSTEDIELEVVDDEDSGPYDSKAVQIKLPESRKGKTSLGMSRSNKKRDSCGGAENKGTKVLDSCGPSPPEASTGAEFTDAATKGFGLHEAEKLHFIGKNRKDALGRHPGDENYDPKTLYLPPDFLKSLSGGQRQWWEFKSKHMDKVLFFKMGKFYELFEMDAHVGSRELGLQYMKGEQPHCGFPEKNFSMNVEKLARKGFRVLVVEQTETPEQLELRRKEKGSRDKVVKREICAVVTKGTLTEGEMFSTNPDASYLMAITESCRPSMDKNDERVYGVCVTDVATNRVILGQFGDDLECSALSCLLAELRPVEIIKPAKLLTPETERAILRHTRSPLVNDLVPFLEFWDAGKTISEVKNMHSHSRQSVDESSGKHDLHETDFCKTENSGCLPDVLSKLHDAGDRGSCALSALGGILFYLKQAFLDVTLIKFGKFELLPCSGFTDITQNPYMILDAASLENLEIFENSKNGDASGTLYAQVNHCMTASGKRLLKTWLARPLFNLNSIKARQDAVAGLKGANLPFALKFRKELSRLPDTERLLARLFASSESSGRNANKVVLYEDAAKRQLKEFISALRACELMSQSCFSLGAILDNVNSVLLNYLLTAGSSLADINSVVKHFKDAFDWAEAGNSGCIIPHDGVDTEYDSATRKVKEIEFGLAKHLKEQRRLLEDASINFVTVGKEAYLLEVSESLCGSIPQSYELRSSKKGFFRYWNPSIRRMLGELSHAELEKESKLKSILQRLVGNFCEHHQEWKKLVAATAELDVLISLAIASDYYEGPTCRPVISALSGSNEVPYYTARCLGHPVFNSDSVGRGPFVPNDIVVGGSGNASFILLTGPNMGGKSTLLRQVCLAVILAQVGADVPAESFELSPVDRIFVRMGAKDHIMEGQSTFLTELSETAFILSSATRNSLVALDELGRGTSTSDGQAIAESVLEHLVYMVQCRGLFSTHYHRLAINYQRDPQVCLCHMACQVGKGTRDAEEVTFLYRLMAGACPKSYGVNVARLAGLPECVLATASSKSREFEAAYGKQERAKKVEAADLIRRLVKWSWDSSEKMEMGFLRKLQHRAKVVVGHN